MDLNAGPEYVSFRKEVTNFLSENIHMAGKARTPVRPSKQELEWQKKLIDNGEMLPLMEAFYTIQGEGFHKGSAAYFIRIGGCDVGCHWCDVKESWDSLLHPPTLTTQIVQDALIHSDTVVITGGEPLMWNMNFITSLLRRKNKLVHIETSGAYDLSGEWDWICLSPKKK